MDHKSSFAVGVLGASGFVGAELLRLLALHPAMELKVATADSKVGEKVGGLYPHLAAAYPDLAFTGLDASALAGLDLVFLAMPHGASQKVMPELRGQVGHIVDLAADFRLNDAALYPTWYGEEHHAPELLADFVYGLPELFRDQLKGAELIAAPGCYVTTASLTLGPLLHAGLIEPTGIIVDAASGTSGAGRAPKDNTTFCAVDENFSAYGLLNHRHTPEIEMVISAYADTTAQVLFTPHLAPMNRGILATCYARPVGTPTTEDLLGALNEAYSGEPFVVVDERSPETKATLGSNSAHLTARFDERTNTVIAIGALDNLTKGASGQGLQCANLALGLDETLGLATAGMYP